MHRGAGGIPEDGDFSTSLQFTDGRFTPAAKTPKLGDGYATALTNLNFNANAGLVLWFQATSGGQ